MAEFIKAFQKTIDNEGGYVNDPDDPGGETYKGISRKMFSKWEGWTQIDMLKRQSGFPSILDSNSELREQVGTFYLNQFWNRIKGDEINNQAIAESIFDFAVNAGVKTSIKLAQKVVGVDDDGIVGKDTIYALNTANPRLFIAEFKLAKIQRYADICDKNSSQKVFFFGWVKRALK